MLYLANRAILKNELAKYWQLKNQLFRGLKE